MFQRIYSVILSGLSGVPVEIECFIGGGLPYFNIVGLSGSAAASARERIRSALKSSGFPLPPSRITVNIHPIDPVDLPTIDSPTCLDLPIALSILACQSLFPVSAASSALFIGELSLNGELRPLSGALTLAHTALTSPFQSLYLPDASASISALSGHPHILGVTSLSQILSVLRGHISLPSTPPAKPETSPVSSSFDSILGQTAAKRALMIAAAGMHNLLLIGPPGCGKTLLARSLSSLLPPLTLAQQIQLTEIYSCAGLLSTHGSLLQQRPFRAPHHTTPASSLVGGGSLPRPGEITLAHHGVLYLDELPEFSRSALESLRQPLEDHSIAVNRLRSSFIYPADFLLMASMNPCPCGYYPDTQHCRCSASRIHQYWEKIDTPLLDRIDLILQMPAVSLVEPGTSALSFSEAFHRVQIAHLQQQQRFQQESRYNSRMTLSEIQQFCSLSPSLQHFMDTAYAHYHLTMRSYHKILKLSRTLADLDESPDIQQSHLAQALQYRFTLPS